MATGEKEADRAHSALETGLYSDLVLEINHGTEKHSIKAHRIILTLASSVWASAVKWSEDGVLKVTEFPYTTMHAVIYFAYTGRVTFEDLTHCQRILAAAHYYDMPKLSLKCGEYIQVRFLKNELDLGTVIQLFNMAALYDSEIVVTNCLAYIQDNTKLVLDSKEFLNISADALMMILVKGMFLCSENYMIRSVLRWATDALTKSNLEDLREFLIRCDFLPHFRLGRLQMDEMQALCKDYPTIFSGESSLLLSRDSFPIDNDDEFTSKGVFNQDLDMQVIVRRPPMVICEEFYNNGPTVAFPIFSTEIEARYNSVNPDFNGRYEEKFSISIENIVGYFEGVVDKRDGATVYFPTPVNLMIERDSTFNIYITLEKCGVYYKNSKFSIIGDGLFRQRPGLVTNINNFFVKPSTSTENRESAM